VPEAVVEVVRKEVRLVRRKEAFLKGVEGELMSMSMSMLISMGPSTLISCDSFSSPSSV
jgi:hypothetical protein